MSLARAWTRQLYGASGAALLAPATLLTAVCVVLFGGGLGAFGSIAQVFAGPGVPATGVPGAGTRASAQAPVGGLPVVAPAITGARAAAGPGPSSPGSASGAAHPGGSGPRLGSGPSGQRGSTGPTQGAGGGASPGGAGANGGPTPPPSRPPTALDRVISALTGVTQRLPGPVGNIGTQTLQSVGNTLDGVVPPPGHGQIG